MSMLTLLSPSCLYQAYIRSYASQAQNTRIRLRCVKVGHSRHYDRSFRPPTAPKSAQDGRIRGLAPRAGRQTASQSTATSPVVGAASASRCLHGSAWGVRLSYSENLNLTRAASRSAFGKNDQPELRLLTQEAGTCAAPRETGRWPCAVLECPLVGVPEAVVVPAPSFHLRGSRDERSTPPPTRMSSGRIPDCGRLPQSRRHARRKGAQKA
jgi:hypothetical protein